MKQTAVEFLEEKAMNGFITPEDFEQAKAMEKEQMLEVSKAGCFGTFEFEDYYNETYNSERIEQIKSE